ncbi:MAG: TIGR02217 family protein [Ancylobacter novellus]|uniref:TIGR02217 family protein n=1 Tax=Ancylobacter novellus TaxID=921 RepID=A0A2W5KJ04_ANCNO|nr:MAG: TIGR02217 family protein [Ancylobacter novellus]
MTPFHDVRFPTDIARGARGGPERRTEIATLGSGFEERNAVWAHSRRRWDAGLGVRTLAQLQAVVAFFEERRGRLVGFRFRDPLDHSSALPGAAPAPTDQHLGEGDGETKRFALRKTYGGAFDPYRRPIRKPVAGTVRVAVGGVETAAFALDLADGSVVLDAAPAAGAPVSAGFEFDTPVRFDADRLEVDLAAFGAGSAPSVPLIEIRLG